MGDARCYKALETMSRQATLVLVNTCVVLNNIREHSHSEVHDETDNGQHAEHEPKDLDPRINREQKYKHLQM